MGGAAEDRTVVFTYGTLKRGFSNHSLMQDLILSNDAAFISPARTAAPIPLVCGPYRVPFLINRPGAAGAAPVAGELYSVSARGLARLDELEGIVKGHYERLPVTVIVEEEEVAAIAYFAHRSFGEELWKRSGERGLGAYSELETRGYVWRKDRPKDTTFLEQIRIFVAGPPE